MNELVIVGVGGGGASMAEITQKTTGGRGIVINTDTASLNKHPFTEKLLLASPARITVEAMAPEIQLMVPKIQSMISGARTLVITVGLGGQAGSSIAPAISRIAKEIGIEVIAAATLPFSFEGEARTRNAKEALKSLHNSGAIVFIHDHANQSFSGMNNEISMNEWMEMSAVLLTQKVMDFFRQRELSTK